MQARSLLELPPRYAVRKKVPRVLRLRSSRIALPNFLLSCSVADALFTSISWK
jgi:hypothetical protein